MSKGVLLIALGHPAYFSMARNLAATIKKSDPSLSICVVTEGNRAIETALFERAVVAEPKHFTHDGRTEYIKAKLWAYELSPYTETLLLDVDQVVMPGRKLSELFTGMEGVELTFSNTGPADVSLWANIAEVQQVYGKKPFWNYHSELVYFKKGKTAKHFFATARKVYGEGKLSSAYAFSGAAMADELAFQVASILTGLYPHKEAWLPNFWHRRHPEIAHRYPYQLAKDYYTYSIGGSTVPAYIAKAYNNLAADALRSLGLQHPYQARHKAAFLPERAKI